ncbi:MAG: hypothetical protein PHQ81_04735 [Methanofollis sp.]|nr:hypothetical protein [Methanofollis sp.]
MFWDDLYESSVEFTINLRLKYTGWIRALSSEMEKTVCIAAPAYPQRGEGPVGIHPPTHDTTVKIPVIRAGLLIITPSQTSVLGVLLPDPTG